eukprot:EG_transcript_28039
MTVASELRLPHGRTAAMRSAALAALQRDHLRSLSAAPAGPKRQQRSPKGPGKAELLGDQSFEACHGLTSSEHASYFEIMRRQFEECHNSPSPCPTEELSDDPRPAFCVDSTVEPPTQFHSHSLRSGWSPFDGPVWLAL